MILRKLPLNEVTRWDIIRRSKIESPERFQKQRFYKAKDFNNVDFESLFTTDTFTWSSRVGDYIVVISFEGAFVNLYNIVGSWSGVNRWKRIDLKMLTKCLSKALDEEDLYIACSCPDFCLHENTKIKSLDGNNYTVKEMYDKFNNGEDLWVYSTDEKGDFKPGHVSDVWISGYSNEMIKITLDNDEEIITTPNHLYMLRNGEYSRADSLTVGQSLMPLYFSYKNGYESVMLNSKPKSFVSVYKTIADCVLQEEINEAKIRSNEDIVSIHHKDFNKLNNLPSNLYPMGHQEHYKYHYNHVMDNKESFNKFVNAGHEYWRTDEGRKIKSDQMKKSISEFWANMTDDEKRDYVNKSHSWQHTEDGHEKMSNARKKYWENLDMTVKKERLSKSSIYLNGENGEKASKRIKEYWANLTEDEYKRRCEQCREAQKHATTTEKCIEARRKNGKKRQHNLIVSRGREILDILIEKKLEISEENYNKYRKKGYPLYNTIVDYGVLDNFNHKVKKIESIYYDEEIPVYDITVDTYNNFYVSSGVVLHNCYRFDFWATKAGCKYGTEQNRPPKVRNVKNNKGYCCKHLLAVLYGKRWVPAAAKAWYSYIRTNPELAEELIWG